MARVTLVMAPEGYRFDRSRLQRYWQAQSVLPIPASLADGDQPTSLTQVLVANNGLVSINTGADLNGAFETKGRVTFELSDGTTWSGSPSGRDVREPYNWIDSSIRAFYTQAGRVVDKELVVTLDDGEEPEVPDIVVSDADVIIQEDDEMPYLSDIERDVQYAELRSVDHFGSQIQISSQPIVRNAVPVVVDLGQALHWDESVTLATLNQRASGLFFSPVKQDMRTAFRIQGKVWASHLGVTLSLAIGASVTGPLFTEAGDHMLSHSVVEVPGGNLLAVDKLYAVNNPTGLYRNQPFVWMLLARNFTGAEVTGHVMGSLSVQRLVEPGQPVFDRKRQ